VLVHIVFLPGKWKLEANPDYDDVEGARPHEVYQTSIPTAFATTAPTVIFPLRDRQILVDNPPRLYRFPTGPGDSMVSAVGLLALSTMLCCGVVVAGLTEGLDAQNDYAAAEQSCGRSRSRIRKRSTE
jgi:hypothetical protein